MCRRSASTCSMSFASSLVYLYSLLSSFYSFFFFNDTATTEIYTLSLHDALPILRGKPGFVPHRWASLGDAVSWIRASGGIAVVAHPGRYNFSKPQLHAFLAEFRDCGGAGIEVVTGSHSPEQYSEFARITREFGFSASRGSDYHGKGESRADLGALPQLPDDLKPVWHDW